MSKLVFFIFSFNCLAFLGAVSTSPGSSTLWPNGSTIYFDFVSQNSNNENYIQPSEEELARFRFIAEHAILWSNYANLNFEFVYKIHEDGEKKFVNLESGIEVHEALINVSVDPFANRNSSTIGMAPRNEIKFVEVSLTSRRFEGTIYHEFGHMLGLIHEHQRNDSELPLEEERVREVFGERFDQQKVQESLGDRESYLQRMVDNYALTDNYVAITSYDTESIMHYFLHDYLVEPDQQYVNNTLSLGDRLTIAMLYPGRMTIAEVRSEFAEEQAILQMEEQMRQAYIDSRPKIGNCQFYLGTDELPDDNNVSCEFEQGYYIQSLIQINGQLFEQFNVQCGNSIDYVFDLMAQDSRCSEESLN